MTSCTSSLGCVLGFGLRREGGGHVIAMETRGFVDLSTFNWRVYKIQVHIKVVNNEQLTV